MKHFIGLCAGALVRHFIALSLLVAVPLLISPRAAAQTSAAGPSAIWYAPAPQSPDLADMFRFPDRWTRARALIKEFEFSPSELRGPTYKGLVGVNAFAQLQRWGIGVAIEVPSVKDWDCTGQRTPGAATKYAELVTKAGGQVNSLSLDEPIAAGTRYCHQTIEDTARIVSGYLKSVRQALPHVLIGDIEGYPSFSVDQISHFVTRVMNNGGKFDFFHLDVNVPAVGRFKDRNLANDVPALQRFFSSRGIPFGIIIWNGFNPTPSDKQFYDDAIKWMRVAKPVAPHPDHLIVQSWVTRSSLKCSTYGKECSRAEAKCGREDPRFCGSQSVPLNLPESGLGSDSLTRLVLEAANFYGL